MTQRTPTRTVVHNRSTLALHRLRAGELAPGLLLLHALGLGTPDDVPAWAARWPGDVWGLDFTGHGSSTVPLGGGYSCEALMGDVDAALSVLGPCAVVGQGLGAYVALLIAGARPTLVRGVLLADGAGLAGEAEGPGVPMPNVAPSGAVPGSTPTAPDPWALLELSRDLRPPDYAASFARLAVHRSGLDEPILVACRFRPRWLQAVVEEYGVTEVESLAAGVERLRPSAP
jgi:pimeloyl-ACP methyl ester carboxylesterase